MGGGGHSVAINPALGSLFTFSSGPVQVPSREDYQPIAAPGQLQAPETMVRAKQKARRGLIGPTTRKMAEIADLRKRSFIPTNNQVLALFRRMQNNEPDVGYNDAALKITLLKEEKWVVSRKRITQLWNQARMEDTDDTDEADAFRSGSTEEVNLAPVMTMQTNTSSKIPSPTINDFDNVHPVLIDTYGGMDASLNSQLALTTPSDMEIMTFLWDLEEDHTGIKEDTRDLLQFIIRYKNWKISEGRLLRILDEIEEADAEDTFDVQTVDDGDRSLQPNEVGLEIQLSPTTKPKRAESKLDKAQEEIQNALIAPSSGQKQQSLREILNTRVRAQKARYSCKITNMLLDLADTELVSLIADKKAFKQMVDELHNLCANDVNKENMTADVRR